MRSAATSFRSTCIEAFHVLLRNRARLPESLVCLAREALVVVLYPFRSPRRCRDHLPLKRGRLVRLGCELLRLWRENLVSIGLRLALEVVLVNLHVDKIEEALKLALASFGERCYWHLERHHIFRFLF